MKNLTIFLAMLFAVSTAWGQATGRSAGNETKANGTPAARENVNAGKETTTASTGRRTAVAPASNVTRSETSKNTVNGNNREGGQASVKNSQPALTPPAGNKATTVTSTGRDGQANSVTTGRRTTTSTGNSNAGSVQAARNTGPASAPNVNNNIKETFPGGKNPPALNNPGSGYFPPREVYQDRPVNRPNVPLVIRPRPVNIVLPPPPVRLIFYWTPEIRVRFSRYYPEFDFYRYPAGYRLRSVSIYDAAYFRGEMASVYGRVYEVYYSRATDEYLLYFGDRYPYHYFTAVVPGYVAERFSRRPWRYFRNEHLMVTGLITMFDGLPEIAVRSWEQIQLY